MSESKRYKAISGIDISNIECASKENLSLTFGHETESTSIMVIIICIKYINAVQYGVLLNVPHCLCIKSIF